MLNNQSSFIHIGSVHMLHPSNIFCNQMVPLWRLFCSIFATTTICWQTLLIITSISIPSKYWILLIKFQFLHLYILASLSYSWYLFMLYFIFCPSIPCVASIIVTLLLRMNLDLFYYFILFISLTYLPHILYCHQYTEYITFVF